MLSLPIITKLLLDQDDETLDSFMLVCNFYEQFFNFKS